MKLEYLGANPLDLSPSGGLSGHVDYVGVTKAAGRVMGVGQWISDSLRPKLDPVLRWPVPRGWAAADAATVPFVYATMYHALKVREGDIPQTIRVQQSLTFFSKPRNSWHIA